MMRFGELVKMAKPTIIKLKNKKDCLNPEQSFLFKPNFVHFKKMSNFAPTLGVSVYKTL